MTKSGLEDQLLAVVVKADRPDLEEQKAFLTRQQNEFKITLKSLEDDLLQRLSSAGEDILSDSSLVENLENTKKTAAEIEGKVKLAKITSDHPQKLSLQLSDLNQEIHLHQLISKSGMV